MTAKHLLSEIVALTVDWDGTDMKDAEHTRSEIECGKIRSIAAYVDQLEKALEPFAAEANQFAETWPDGARERPDKFNLGDLRRARAALGGSNE